MREKYMLALANLVNGSELGYEDRSSIPQYKKDIEDYVDSLEEQNKRYKEVIDKTIELLNNPWSFESGNKEVDEITHKKKWEIINLFKEVE